MDRDLVFGDVSVCVSERSEERVLRLYLSKGHAKEHPMLPRGVTARCDIWRVDGWFLGHLPFHIKEESAFYAQVSGSERKPNR